ncbi:MAG TPA: lysine--tRNA ligase [Bdellovibrionota bacterium]|nr:lysine--tRNA ligase [Bdellovibrionota bacterium]
MTPADEIDSKEAVFWADQSAREIIARRDRYVVATGITPSGEIHIGNMREVVTADTIVRVLREPGHNPQLKYIADTYDPLRRVYPFLDPQKYASHIGKPLSEIPCPCEKHESYAEHFLEPFLRSLKALDIQVEIFRADRMYKDGQYTQNIIRALEGTERIRAILKEATGKKTDEHWSPFNPLCNTCKRMIGTIVTDFDAAEKTVSYKCDCGDNGSAPMAGGGKLTWRVDWAARWEILGVTIEPFGKDHASAGGSYDSGVKISKEIFGYEPPFPIVYEWISLRGGGDMSSSKGNVISIHEMLEVVPAEVLKYAVVKVKPNRRIVFDPGLPLLQLIDEFDDPTSPNRHRRAAELSAVPGSPPVKAPFRHIVSLVQTTQNDIDEMAAILKRSGYDVSDLEALKARATYARKWLDRFAPEEVRFEVQKTLPPTANALKPHQKKALGLLADKLRSGMNADEIHSVIYSVKDKVKATPQELFEAIYQALLGKSRGPRAGFFLASLETEFLAARFKEVAATPGSGS